MASAVATGTAQRRKGSKRPTSQLAADQPSSAEDAPAASSPKKLKISLDASNVKTEKDVEANSSTNAKKSAKEVKQEPAEVETPFNKENQTKQVVTAFDWTADELSQLVTNLTACLPKNDTVKYSTLIEKLDWEKVRFGKYTAAECKEKWQQVMTKLRRYRTLTDMVTDAIEWLKHPWSSYHTTKKTQKHPEMPKKPLTPYFRYFLEKREKYSRENPDMSMTDLAKLLSKKFQDLPEKKKQKYRESYERENEIYRRELDRFKKEHPDQYPGIEAKQSHPTQGPEKPQTPFQLFANDKMMKAEFMQMEKREATEKIRQLWNGLSDTRRVKWVQKAVDEEQRYLMELEEYCQANPEFKPEALKPILSKAEKELKDRCDGKPDRPPNSGYSLFSRILLRELTNFPSKEKMAEISKRWKMLPDAERENYNKQALKANQRYREKYALYLSKLPAHERKKLEEVTRNVKKKVPNGSQASAAAASEAKKDSATEEAEPPKAAVRRPMSALQFYQQEKLTAARQKNPQLTRAELLKLMTREFNALSDKKKAKYENMALEAKKNHVSDESAGGKKKLFKGEPKKPPQSGYSLFSSELLTKLKDFEPKDRMGEIAKRWKVMSNGEREKYNKRAQELTRKYNKEFQKFLVNLSPEELQEYEKTKKKGGKGAKNDKVVIIQGSKALQSKKGAGKSKDAKKEASDSSSSEEGSSDDEEDDDDEEEDGENDSQSSNADSDSGSGDSDSDSDDSDESGDESKKDGSKDGSSSEDSDSDSESDSNSGSSSEEGSDSDSDSEEEE